MQSMREGLKGKVLNESLLSNMAAGIDLVLLSTLYRSLKLRGIGNHHMHYVNCR